MNKLKNNQGSALVWVLVICVIFGILGVAIGWVALSMNERSVANNNLNQAYFTARSGADAVLSQLNGYPKGTNEDDSVYKYLYDKMINKTEVIEIENLFETIPSIGKCSLKGEYSKGMVKLAAKSNANEENAEVVLWGRRKAAQTTEWPSIAWASQLNTGVTNKIVVGTNETLEKDKRNTDVAVYQVNNDIEGVLSIARDKDTQKKAIFIYVREGGKLTINGISYEDANGADKWFVSPEDSESTNKINWKYYYGPDVFIYVEGGNDVKSGGELSFKNANTNPLASNEKMPYPFYIFTEQNAGKPSKVTSQTNDEIEVYYAPTSVLIEPNLSGKKDWLKCEVNSDKTPKRLPISGYSESGMPSSTNGIIVDQWIPYKYEGVRGV